MKWILPFVLIITFFSCKKESANASITNNDTTTYPTRKESPFGVMVEGIADASRIKTIKLLGVTNVRA